MRQWMARRGRVLAGLVLLGGPIAFAIIFNVWGGGVPVTDAKHPVPMPRQWFQGAVGNFEVPDGVFARIWK